MTHLLPPRESYPSDMTQSQWDAIELLLPEDSEFGRNRAHSLREIVNAINYRWTTGCSWRMLPHDFPQWQTVYTYFRNWQSAGLLGGIRKILISRKYRARSETRPPQMLESTNPEREISSPVLSQSSRGSVSERARTSAWPVESSWSPRRS